MIFDRTKQDVDNAIRVRAEKVQGGLELTEEDVEILERGTMTINTLNRIEQKQSELKDLFNSMGYWNTPLESKIWNENQIFNIDDFQRLIDNTNILREAFFIFSNTPRTPVAKYYYENINNLENILSDLDLMITDIKSRYKICGTFNCGVSE
jgi:hypothetical protein